jgi:glutamine synthetase
MLDEVQPFLSRFPDTRYVDAFITDLAGRAMGKRFPVSHLEKVFAGKSQLCAANTLLDITGNTADPLGHGFSDGDPDANAVVVPGTLKPVPWAQVPSAQCLLTLKDAVTGEPVWFEPRVVLQRVLKKFSDTGFMPVVASELEFYLIDRARSEAGWPQPPINPRTGERAEFGKVFSFDELDDFGDVLGAIEDACKTQGIPASTSLSEYGAGQFEVNLEHTSDVLRAADDACLLRRAVTNVARRAGFDATFLSKPFAEQAGNGLHVHVSLVDADGGNVFAKDETRLAQAVGGLQATMAEAMALFAPHINAYRRFAPDQFVPVTTDWGENNRSVAFRVPASDDAARRIEHRVAGADANPYLVIAAVLAGIHHGLENKLAPGEKHTGNAGAEIDESLPLTIWRALDAFENGKILPDYLGERYIAAYAEVKRAEFNDFMSVPSKREFDWYL